MEGSSGFEGSNATSNELDSDVTRDDLRLLFGRSVEGLHVEPIVN